MQVFKKILAKKKIPEFFAGDTIKVGVRIAEGKRERIQYFEGVCIAKRNRSINSSFTVRKISFGEGVERTFALYSSIIGSIKIIRSGKVRRAKLYYLRERKGKSARISEKIKKSIGIDISAQENETETIKETAVDTNKPTSETKEQRIKKKEKNNFFSIMPQTLYDKIWNEHIVHQQNDGIILLYVDRHLIHEVTSPQAFEGFKTVKKKSKKTRSYLSCSRS